MAHQWSQEEQEQEQEGPGASSIIELHPLEGDCSIYDTLSEAADMAPDPPLYDNIAITIDPQCSTLPEAEEYIDMSFINETYSNIPPLSTANYYDTVPQRQRPSQLHPDGLAFSGSTERRRVKPHVHSILMITSLCIAVLSIILILVLSFSVYRPNMEALKEKLDEIDGESAKTRQTINELNATIAQISSFVMLENLTFLGQDQIETDLKNVDIYSSCIHEYISSCSLPTNVSHCITGYHDVIVDGYTNLDLACHIDVAGKEALPFYPVTSLRMSTRSGETVQPGDSASVRFGKSVVSCECTLEPQHNGSLRNKEINCLLYRLRCPITSTIENVLIKP